MDAIALWWIGSGRGDPAVLADLLLAAEGEFGRRVVVHQGEARPGDIALDPQRGQHLSWRLLDWLEAHPVPGAHWTLALTDADLFLPVLTYVFGEARLGGRVAVLSSARLSPPQPNLLERRLARRRLVKEGLHELGHTFGLVHCADTGCVMSRSPGIRQVDAKSARLCGDCRADYEERRSDPAREAR